MDDTPNGLPEGEVTVLLRRWQAGDVASRDQLFGWIEQDLRRRARRLVRQERQDHTLQATALVNEAYLRLADGQQLDWRNRSHFFAIASTVMRRILVEHARRRQADKRGANPRKVVLAEGISLAQESTDEEILAVHQALEKLAEIHPRQARIIEMRFFVGMKLREVAEALDLSVATVKNELMLGRAWLFRELGGK